MDRRQLSDYLSRIGLDDDPSVDVAGLTRVQCAHLSNVPFENLDIIAGRLPLPLDEDSLFDKIVRRRRGGICYEQNLLFAAALQALGFKVALKGGRHPRYGDDMDHLFLLVEVDDQVPMIADVGFAANFARPLRLVAGVEQDDGRDRFMLEEAFEIGDGYLRLLRIPGLVGAAEPQEMFAFGPHIFQPEDCRERCDWFSTSSESRFTQGPLISIDKIEGDDGGGGRKTLSANHYIETRGGVRSEVEIETPGQFADILYDVFGLDAEGIVR